MMSVSSECCAYGCRNRPDYKVPGITFHVFPKDPVKRKAWIEAVKKKNNPDFEPPDHIKICSEHFAEECFDRSKKRVMLLANAVPTIFGTPKSIPNVKHPLAKIYSNGSVKRKLPESEDEDHVIFREPSEYEDEYYKEDNSSSSESPLEESEPEETPETEVVYVSEEAMGSNKPSIIKVVSEKKPQPTVAVHNDIMKALETYSKMKPSSTATKGEVSLVMLQPPTSPNDPMPQVLTPVQLVEFSPQALTELYERNIKELKTARQKARRYKAKIARLEKIVRNFERCGSSEEEDSEEELVQIEVNGVYEQLRRKQEEEESEDGGSDLVNLEAGES